MSVIQRVVKPKTRRGKLFLENRLPKLIENEKTAMFIRGANANGTVIQAMKDIATFKKPKTVFLNRKNDIRPFEDTSSLEFLSQKNDSSLFMFGSNNKKRPNNIVMGRTFDGHILDMFELGIENFRSLHDFKNSKFVIGSKPLLVFSGEQFESEPTYQRLKNLLMDFFSGPSISNVNLKGVDHVIVFTEVAGKLHVRCYRIIMKRSSTRTPDVELEEIGPHMDLTLRRTRIASNNLFKTACRKPLQLEPKKVKNVSRDRLGTTHGRIHMERQNYDKLQTRKMKALKAQRNAESTKKRKLSESSATEISEKLAKTE